MPAGAPLGNQNAAKAKRWEAAVIRAFEAWPEAPDSTDCNDLMRGLNAAAHEFVRNVMTANDLGYFREVGDRFDGKAAQQVIHSGDPESPVRIFASSPDEKI